MRPRQTLLELFSTFLQFEAERFSSWATDARLRRSMNACLNKSVLEESVLEEAEGAIQPSQSGKFWAIYWYKLWQTCPTGLGQAHLAAYLQEVCYWASQKTLTRFTITQYTLSDCFQVAIARIDKVLKRFDPTYGSDLKTYASIAFSRLIQDFLKQQQIVDICSDWGLLRKLSQKRLAAALENAMFPAQTIAAYLLAWRCLKAIYVPNQAKSTYKLPKPDDAIWTAVAQLYNKERLTQLSAPGSEVSPAMLEKWMQNCVKAIRAYLYPSLTSINAPRQGQESGELIDTLTDDQHNSLLTDLIAEEDQQIRQKQQTQINQVLTTALGNLDPQVQRLLELYYAQNLTQQEMAKQLDMKQYTISRRFSKAREVLLLALARWSQDTLHTVPTSDVLNPISHLLEEWLTAYYGAMRLN